MKPWIFILTVLLIGLDANADITASFRKANAVALYEFQDTDDIVRDTADAKFGPALNLKINAVGPYSRSPGVLELKGVSQIISQGPATKIFDKCSASNEVSVEIHLENNENVEQRSGIDKDRVLQPLRIVSYSKGLFSRNFTVGQVYDGGNMYAATTTNTDNNGRSLVEPLVSDTSAIMVPDGSGASHPQKVIFTFKNGTARMYLTDRDGHMYHHRMASNDFQGNLSNWDASAFLLLGNEYVANASSYGNSTNYKSCDPKVDAVCGSNPNRFWKGKLFLVAVYCKELTRSDIFGAQLQLVTNPIFEINPNLTVTPELIKAQEIYQRLTGTKTPIVNDILSKMASKISSNDPIGAAALVTDGDSSAATPIEPNSNFYNIVVRDFAAKMSNRDETINVPLNEFTATFIGAVRDQINAKRLLTDDLVYIADPNKAAVPSNLEMDMIKSNNHYDSLAVNNFDLRKVLVPTTQKIYDGKNVVPNPTPAGLLTSRQWLAAHAIAGTNRRAVEFTFREFLCIPLEKVADATGPDDVIGRDIDRFPGGSHTKFVTTCRACHTIMDGFRGAFAHFTFSNNIVKHGFVAAPIADPNDEANSFGMVQNPTYISGKMNHNDAVFPGGRVIVDDNWFNNAIYGANATTFGWASTKTGKGIKAFGQLIADSKQFPKCMTNRVFKSVCKRDPEASDDTFLNSVSDEFSTTRNYNLKFLFQKIVTSKECLGGN